MRLKLYAGITDKPVKMCLAWKCYLFVIYSEPAPPFLTLGVNHFSGLLTSREISRSAFETPYQNTIITFGCCYAHKQVQRSWAPVMVESLWYFKTLLTHSLSARFTPSIKSFPDGA